MVPKLVFVGGFLGAGKTTLILESARIVESRGLRVALIVNDQDSELVDAQYARAENFATREVAGGCFCCRFSDLLDHAKALLAYNPDIIFGEPVGSCIDLAATILRPFQSFHQDTFEVAPLTVLLDPELTREVLEGDAPPEVAYLFMQQIREADIICMTKADIHPAIALIPFPVDFQISARSGLGVERWLEEVLAGRRVAGACLLDVDYQQYADAEAALGWLNVHAFINLDEAASPAVVVGPLLDNLDAALTAASIRIAHLKLFDQSSRGYVMASIGTNGGCPDPRGDLISEPTKKHELAINLRALGEAASLRAVVERALSGIPGSIEIQHIRAFHPPPPTPEYRQ